VPIVFSTAVEPPFVRRRERLEAVFDVPDRDVPATGQRLLRPLECRLEHVPQRLVVAFGDHGGAGVPSPRRLGRILRIRVVAKGVEQRPRALPQPVCGAELEDEGSGSPKRLRAVIRETRGRKRSPTTNRPRDWRALGCNGISTRQRSRPRSENERPIRRPGRFTPGRFGARSSGKGMRVNKQEFVESLAEQCDSSKVEAGRVLDAILDSLTQAMADGEEVRLTGFGTFSSQRRRARESVNPQDPSQKIRIRAAHVPSSSPARRYVRLLPMHRPPRRRAPKRQPMIGRRATGVRCRFAGLRRRDQKIPFPLTRPDRLRSMPNVCWSSTTTTSRSAPGGTRYCRITTTSSLSALVR
jgi:DNA-binding protein HU-beta